MLKIVLLLFFFSVHQADAQNTRLKKTAKIFNAIVAQSNVSKAEYKERLSLFIDPAANVDSLVNDYYAHWKKSRTEQSFPTKVKVKKVNKPTKDTAILTINCEWFDLEFGSFLYISESIWYRKNEQWYRSGIPEKLISTKKLKSK